MAFVRVKNQVIWWIDAEIELVSTDTMFADNNFLGKVFVFIDNRNEQMKLINMWQHFRAHEIAQFPFFLSSLPPFPPLEEFSEVQSL